MFSVITVSPCLGHPRRKSGLLGQRRRQWAQFWDMGTTARGQGCARLPTKLDKVNRWKLFFFISKFPTLRKNFFLSVGEMRLFSRYKQQQQQCERRKARVGISAHQARHQIRWNQIVIQAGEWRERQQGPSRGGCEQPGSSIEERKQGERGEWSQFFGGAKTWFDGEGWRAERRAEADKAALFLPGLPSSSKRTQVYSRWKEFHFPEYLQK